MGTAGKYATIVGISLALVLIMAWTGAILDVWFGLMVLTVLFALGWIAYVLPQIRMICIILICSLALYAFILPAFIRIMMPTNVQRAWETSKIASYTKLATWLYNSDARGGRNLEELCRAENYRLTNGDENSEIGRTIKKIRDLVTAHGADLGVLTTIRKSPSEMSLDQVFEMQDSKEPVDRYRALQRMLQIQRENAVAEYERCLGKAPAVAGTKNDSTASPSSDATKSLKIEVDLKEMTLKKVAKGAVPVLYMIAGACFGLSFICAVIGMHKGADGLLKIAVVLAIGTTILYFVVHAPPP